MTLILANLPKQYQDAAKNYIQQTMRPNVSGKYLYFELSFLLSSFDFTGTNSPSSPLSGSSPKPLLSPPQYGPFSLQNHVSSKKI